MAGAETWSSGTRGYEPDFVERNGAWLLSVLGIMGTCVSAMLVYFLKSRCSTIKCCGMECQRDVLDLSSVPDSAFELEQKRRQSTPLPQTQAPARRFNFRPLPKTEVELTKATASSDGV